MFTFPRRPKQKMLMHKNDFISHLICPNCGLVFPIPRKKSSKRGKNHIKDLYCPHCRKVQKFVENKVISEEQGT